MNRFIHIFLTLCVLPNTVIFLLVPPTENAPNWAVPSIVVTLLELLAMRWSHLAYGWDWSGFIPGHKTIATVIRWLGRFVLLFLLPSWFVFLFLSKAPAQEQLVMMYRSVSWLFAAANLFYLSFALLGDGAVISKMTRKRQDGFFAAFFGGRRQK